MALQPADESLVSGFDRRPAAGADDAARAGRDGAAHGAQLVRDGPAVLPLVRHCSALPRPGRAALGDGGRQPRALPGVAGLVIGGMMVARAAVADGLAALAAPPRERDDLAAAGRLPGGEAERGPATGTPRSAATAPSSSSAPISCQPMPSSRARLT